MSSLEAKAEKILQGMSFPVAKSVTKGKVAVIGLDGVVRHLDADLFMNKEY